MEVRNDRCTVGDHLNGVIRFCVQKDITKGMMFRNVTCLWKDPMDGGTDAAVYFAVNQLYRCPPRSGEGGAGMQCTAVYIHRPIARQKVLELISRDLPSA
jgi:hypothetical protein